MGPKDVSDELYSLAYGPEPWVVSYSDCINNGTRFHTRDCEANSHIQCYDVVVSGGHDKDINDYYSVLIDILKLCYMGWHHIYLFKCSWWDISDYRGLLVDPNYTSVNISCTWYKKDSCMLACQVQQVFCLDDARWRGDWKVVQKIVGWNVYDILLVQTCDHEDEEPYEA